ncbi:unnamed protein product [Lactuca saligna]|uniref:Uncharacterized protein n=1 Tax=Lactuca saligna TaxID=75948 RepID=A0AA35Y690_LACSI|nr:unnamed protein product [Lactuca saligna]
MTQSLGEQLSKVEKDVTDIKCSTVVDNDHMMFGDTPPTSLGNHPPHPPPSSNPPLPSYPSLRTSSPLPDSPLQTDDAKKGEKNQEPMMNTGSPSQPEMSKSERDDNQKAIVVGEQERNEQPIPNVDATNNDQPITNFGDQFKTNKYEGFLDLGFIEQIVVPLSVVYPDTFFEGGGGGGGEMKLK